MAAIPKLFYFGIQGRAEPARLVLAAAGVAFEFVSLTREESGKLKQDLAHYKFGQVPRYVDDTVDLCQLLPIVRYLGRKHGLAGKTEAEQAAVEEVIEGNNDLHGMAVMTFRQANTQEQWDAIKVRFWKEHIEPGSETAAETRGVHVTYLSRILASNKTGYFVGQSLTIADLLVADTLELVMRVYKDHFQQAWPDLVKHHDLVMGQEKVAAYLQGPQRLSPMELKFA
ncbi:hypothetical protein N2152v2_000146 [Parachlorella kessleri]